MNNNKSNNTSNPNTNNNNNNSSDSNSRAENDGNINNSTNTNTNAENDVLAAQPSSSSASSPLAMASSPTRSRLERELEERRERQQIDILSMKSNKMFKRCCCYMLILCLAILLPADVTATSTDSLLQKQQKQQQQQQQQQQLTTDAPPPKRSTASSTAEEILEMPHGFRHEEHYSHRIEQAVNDFKRAQLQQLKERDKNLTTNPPPFDAENDIGNENGNGLNKNENKHLLPWQSQSHHRRHEQHYSQQRDLQQLLSPLPEHHMRHSNGQHSTWEERVSPPMRHQRHQQMKQQMNVDIAATAPSTGFIKNKSFDEQRITLNLKADDTFGDDFDDSSEYDDTSENDEGDGDDDNNDDDDDDDVSSDDGSYDSDSDESIRRNAFPRSSSNSYSAIDGKAASVKRYTNPFQNVVSTKKHWNFFDEQKTQHNNDNNNDQRDKTKHSMNEDRETEAVADADTDARNDDSENFTNEKWRRIQEEHFKRQRQHQHEIQALRLRHNPVTTNQISPHEHHNRNEEFFNDDADIAYSNNYIPGSLTLQKIEELGTAEAVQETRRSLNFRRKENRDLANAHVKQIGNEATCRIPQRRVERIQLHPSKTYMPHCTILHRCADDTGCCRSERETCAPKRWKNVDLYFWVKDMDRNKPTIERLTFVNHTECHCIERAEQKPDEYHDINVMTSHNGHDYIALRRATILNCNCPKYFEKILQDDGTCRCDCSSGNTDCNWYKRGMEHFSVIDRKCMIEGRCKPPTCEYGTYLGKHGRCPRYKDFLSASTNNLPSTKSFH